MEGLSSKNVVFCIIFFRKEVLTNDEIEAMNLALILYCKCMSLVKLIVI